LNAGMEYTITDVGWSGEVRVPRPVVAMCNKAPPPSDDLEFSRAYQLVYPNGGKDLPAFYDSDSDAMFEDLLPGFGTVIEGIVKLARNDLVHLDISDFNILFTRNIGRRSDGGKGRLGGGRPGGGRPGGGRLPADKNVIMRLVDFGFMGTSSELRDKMLFIPFMYVSPLMILVRWIYKISRRTMAGTLRQFIEKCVDHTYQWDVYRKLYDAMMLMMNRKQRGGRKEEQKEKQQQQRPAQRAKRSKKEEEQFRRFIQAIEDGMEGIIDSETHGYVSDTIDRILTKRYYAIDANNLGISIASMYFNGIYHSPPRVRDARWCEKHVLPLVYELVSMWALPPASFEHPPSTLERLSDSWQAMLQDLKSA